MNVKAVVKVMNFHALLRVDASRRRAEKLAAMEEELSDILRIVLGNRNLRLDKRVRLPDPSLPVLRIYLGSDFGFCGGINTGVSTILDQDPGQVEKVAVGKRLRHGKTVDLFLTQEQFLPEFGKLRACLEQAVVEKKWSAVELVYNHYYNMSTIKLVQRRIYPMEPTEEETEGKWDDFVVEGDVEALVNAMTLSCLAYEVKIAAASAYASENIMRQNATSESLKKLDELEAEELRLERKEKNRVAFQKTIDNYTRQKSLEEA